MSLLSCKLAFQGMGFWQTDSSQVEGEPGRGRRGWPWWVRSQIECGVSSWPHPPGISGARLTGQTPQLTDSGLPCLVYLIFWG